MKRTIYIWLILALFASVPVIASCPLTGACSPINYPNFSPSSIEDKYIPNNLNNLENSTPNIQQQNPINNNEMQIDTGLGNPENIQPQLPSTEPYNASCQFGTCLP